MSSQVYKVIYHTHFRPFQYIGKIYKYPQVETITDVAKSDCFIQDTVYVKANV